MQDNREKKSGKKGKVTEKKFPFGEQRMSIGLDVATKRRSWPH